MCGREDRTWVSSAISGIVNNPRLVDPEVGNEVSVLFGNRRIPGKISQILPVSAVYPGSQQLLTRDRPATQIARIRFDPGAVPPPLNSSVGVSHALHRAFRPRRQPAGSYLWA